MQNYKWENSFVLMHSRYKCKLCKHKVAPQPVKAQ